MDDRTRCGFVGILTLLLFGCSTREAAPAAPPTSCIVDLSHTYDDDTIYWPTSPSNLEKTTISHGHTSGGYFYSAYSISSTLRFTSPRTGSRSIKCLSSDSWHRAS